MAADKPLIGLTWEPKLPSLSNSRNPGAPASSMTSVEKGGIGASIKPTVELIDGLYVPPNDPNKVNKLMRKQVKDTAGKSWFEMPAPVITPELRNDLKILQLRNVIDPKRHYVKGESKSKNLPKYFQVGTILEHQSEFFSGRLTKKERKTTIADELLADAKLSDYRKRKVREIEEQNRPAGNDKWKIKGKQTLKRAKQRRHL